MMIPFQGKLSKSVISYWHHSTGARLFNLTKMMPWMWLEPNTGASSTSNTGASMRSWRCMVSSLGRWGMGVLAVEYEQLEVLGVEPGQIGVLAVEHEQLEVLCVEPNLKLNFVLNIKYQSRFI